VKLFEPGRIGKLSLKNRIVMAPMGGLGLLLESDGTLSQRAIDYYVARAKGGVGLIITGKARVSREMESRPHINVIDSNLYKTRLSQLAEAVHNYGAKIAVQLSIGAGRNVGLEILKKAGAVSASAVPCFSDNGVLARELTIQEIERFLRAFEFAAKVVSASGADAIEVDGHDGYLLDQFMTGLWNKRTDEYGGDLEGRLRLPIKIIESVKRGAGVDFPIIFRFGLTHYHEGGRGVQEGLEICRRLETSGVAAFHIDAGCYETRYWALVPTTMPRGCLVHLAERVKEVVNIPVITVGRLGYPELAERVLQEEKADFIALGRSLLADPEWPNKVSVGRIEDIRPCIGDYEACFVSHGKPGGYVSCTVNPTTGMEREFTLTQAGRKKSVLVIGGGPGGMEAAIVAAFRGHRVTLWEKLETLGGNLIPASVPDFKQDYRSLKDYLSTQLRKLKVTIELRKEATSELIQEVKPDVVFIAAGGTQIIPGIPGVKREKVVTAIDILLCKKEAGERVTVIGGGLVGCETALYLAQKGMKVTIVEMLDSVMSDLFVAIRMHLLKLFAETNVKILTGITVLEITDAGVSIAAKDGKRSTIEADTVILACGFKPNGKLIEAIKDKVPEVYAIGDCVEPRKVMNAIWEGFQTARLI
jgi:2-enoate reductase